jgi:hypothetical protein
MLLLLLLGGQTPAPGIRAYGHTYYSSVVGGIAAYSSTSLAQSGAAALVDGGASYGAAADGSTGASATTSAQTTEE